MPRPVKSLLKLLAEIDRRWPARDRSSDGWIGDSSHQAHHSDHNPDPDGTVDARDFTQDLSHGANMRIVWDAVKAKRDRRVSYLIFEGQIMSGNNGPSPWIPRAYHGTNGHYHHLHVSVLDAYQDDESPWLGEEDDMAQVPQDEWEQMKKDVVAIKKALFKKVSGVEKEHLDVLEDKLDILLDRP